MNRLIIGLILAGGAILGGVVAYAYMQAFTIPDARQEARDHLIAEQAVQSQRDELERKGDDAKLQRMPDYDLCREYLGRVSVCEQLRQ